MIAAKLAKIFENTEARQRHEIFELSHYSKSQIFVQKFNFDKILTFSRVFHPNFFDNFSREIKVVNS